MTKLEEQRTNASEKVEKLTKELEQARTQGGVRTDVVNELQKELNAVKKKRAALEAELTDKKNETETLEGDMLDLTMQVQEQENKIKEQQEVIDKQKEVNTELTRDKQKLEKERIALKKVNGTNKEIERLKTTYANYGFKQLIDVVNTFRDDIFKADYIREVNKAKFVKDSMKLTLDDLNLFGGNKTEKKQLINLRKILYEMFPDDGYRKSLVESWTDKGWGVQSPDYLSTNEQNLGDTSGKSPEAINTIDKLVDAINELASKETKEEYEQYVEDLLPDLEEFDPITGQDLDFMKPAAPQLHMQKLHMQTSMEKLDLEPAMETVPDDVHVQAVQPMKCGKDMKVEPVACAKHETEHAHGDMKCSKHEPAEGVMKTMKAAKKKAKELAKKYGKEAKKVIEDVIKATKLQCDSCGELHDGDHDCEVEAFKAMLDGYDSEGLALEKPRCASVGLANRKLNELQ